MGQTTISTGAGFLPSIASINSITPKGRLPIWCLEIGWEMWIWFKIITFPSCRDWQTWPTCAGMTTPAHGFRKAHIHLIGIYLNDISVSKTDHQIIPPSITTSPPHQKEKICSPKKGPFKKETESSSTHWFSGVRCYFPGLTRELLLHVARS